MNDIFMFLLMIFNHIIADYNLQGILAKLKQRETWETNQECRHDYVAALLCHAFSWTFMIMLPLAWKMGFMVNVPFTIFFAANFILHAVIDHMKANMYIINLNMDQFLHLFQIILTFICFT